MTAEQIFQLIAVLGGLTGLASIITAVIQKRKIEAEADKSGADAAQVLSAASIALLAPMEKQLNTLSAQLAASQSRANELDDTLRATKTELADVQRMAHGLNRQLQYYRDKYGPPTDELQPMS